MKKLYVIGNGFDKAHKLKTDYWYFRLYLKRYAEDFLRELERLYGFSPMDLDDYHVSTKKSALKKHGEKLLYDWLWKSFEESLGTLADGEIDSICDSAINSMSDIEFGGIGDTLNEYFDKQFKFILELQNYLFRWAKQIRLNKAAVLKKSLQNNDTDLFLTFNYTPVLERVYGIKPSQICHIHGGIPPYCSTPPIIGHGNLNAIDQRRKWQKECADLFDEGGESKNRAFVEFYKKTLKDTDREIFLNIGFFNRLDDVGEVHVIGHSLGAVDMPYFKKIIEQTDDKTRWFVYYHDENDRETFARIMQDIGTKNFQVLFGDEEFWDS